MMLLGWCTAHLPEGQHEKCPGRVDTWGDRVLTCSCTCHGENKEDSP